MSASRFEGEQIMHLYFYYSILCPRWVVGCWLSVVGCHLLGVVDCPLYLSVVVVCCWLSGIGLSSADC